MKDKDKSVGSIITSTGTFEYDDSQDSWFSDNSQFTSTGIVWISPSHNLSVPPSSILTPTARRIQPGQTSYDPFSVKKENMGKLFSLLDPKTLKQMSSIMEQDTVYIRANTIRENESPPADGSFLKVQIHQYPHDWDNSVLVYMSKSYSAESLMQANGIAELLCVIITMSGRDIVFNNKDYIPNGENNEN